jgi:hypothetical protein
MTDKASVQDRLDQAATLREILDAAYQAFEEMLSIIGSYHDSGHPFYAALVMASAPAADGRDAVAAAPSLSPAPPPGPSRRGRHVGTPPATCAATDAAAHVAALANAASEILLRAAGLAAMDADREACHEGARYASEIHGLVGGTRP